ncbi:hypothetical protein RRF57_003135 [Xylaria bambusicola]|uniref:Uncharacterized protein n=1 Tax=Xylaria bambusicola TaxID=326684 RepID=A0AAN7U7J5_9PEZI
MGYLVVFWLHADSAGKDFADGRKRNGGDRLALYEGSSLWAPAIVPSHAISSRDVSNRIVLLGALRSHVSMWRPYPCASGIGAESSWGSRRTRLWRVSLLDRGDSLETRRGLDGR